MIPIKVLGIGLFCGQSSRKSQLDPGFNTLYSRPSRGCVSQSMLNCSTLVHGMESRQEVSTWRYAKGILIDLGMAVIRVF